MKFNKDDYVIAGFLLVFILFLLVGAARADSEHNTYINNGQTNVPRGTALAIAMSQHHFDLGTYETQGSVGTGSFNGSEAISFGIGKRVKNLLISGSVGSEGGKTGYGVGITFRF